MVKPFTTVDSAIGGEEATIRFIGEALQWLMSYTSTGSVTLANGQTTTAIQDTAIMSGSFVSLAPLTAAAAAIKSSIYVSAQQMGQATLTHSAAGAGCDFRYRIQPYA